MERLNINSKRSIYSYIKNKNYEKIAEDIPFKTCEEFIYNTEMVKIQERIRELQKRVIKESQDINEIIKELEYCLPIGNNNKNLSQIFYNSKLFIPLIECVNFAKAKFLGKLLSFIEKLLRGNKHIAKYLSKNIEFVRKIMTLMKNQVSFIYNFSRCLKSV